MPGDDAVRTGSLTSKERMFRALSGESPDVLPAAAGYLCLFLADFERASYIEQYRRCLRGRSRYPVNHEEDTRFRAQAFYQSYSVFKVKPDWIEIYQGATRAWAEQTAIVQEDRVLYYEDQITGHRVPMDTAPIPWGDEGTKDKNEAETDIWDLSAQFRTRDDVDEQVPILTAEQLLARGDYDVMRQVVADYGDDYFITTILSTPFAEASSLLGFYGVMTIQHDRPALFHYLLQRKLTQAREVMATCAAVGIHGVYAQEVYTGADLISPRAYDEFVFAYNQPYFQHMRSLGLLPIHYVCGDAIPRLDRMVQCDIAAVAVEESKKNFQLEIEVVVERVGGRCAVLGNIDAVQFGLHAIAEEMAAEVRRQARIGARARGFMISTGSPFPLDTNPRLLDTMVTTAHSLPG